MAQQTSELHTADAFLNRSSCCRARLVSTEDKLPPPSRVESPTAPEKVTIDPSKGGAVSPKTSQQSRALEVEPGHWIWDGLVKILEVDLFSPAWEVRHGAAMALRELLKAQGKYGGTKGFLFLFFDATFLLIDRSQCVSFGEW